MLFFVLVKNYDFFDFFTTRLDIFFTMADKCTNSYIGRWKFWIKSYGSLVPVSFSPSVFIMKP